MLAEIDIRGGGRALFIDITYQVRALRKGFQGLDTSERVQSREI